MAKKPAVLALIGILALFLFSVFTIEMWINPNIEQEITSLIRAHCKANNLVLVNDKLTCQVSTLSQTLSIDPFAVTLKDDPNARIQFGKTNAKLTMDGMLAFSPLADRVLSKGGTILVSPTIQTENVEVSFSNGKSQFGMSEAKGIAFDTTALKKMLAEGGNVQEGLSVQTIRIASSQTEVKGENSAALSTGEILVSDLKPKFLERITVSDVKLNENNLSLATFDHFTMEKIRIFSNEEAIALADKLSGRNFDELSDQEAEELSIELFNLLAGENPLIGKTSIQNITANATDATPLRIKSIQYTVGNTSKEKGFSVQGIEIPKETISAMTEQELPLPNLLHVDLSGTLTKVSDASQRLSCLLNIRELFTLDMGISSEIKDLSSLLNDFANHPVHDCYLRYTDKSLLARCLAFFIPEGSPKDVILQEIRASITDPSEQPLADDLSKFVEKPGSFEISTEKGKVFRFAELLELNEKELLSVIKLIIREGDRDIDNQIAEIKAK